MNAHRALSRVHLLEPARRSRKQLRRAARTARERMSRLAFLKAVYAGARGRFLRHRLVTVNVERLLLGGENGMGAAEYASRSGAMLRPSTRLIDGPHVNLLLAHRREGDALLAASRLRQTAYVENAMTCIGLSGDYFGARQESEALDVAREFVAWANGGAVASRRGRTPVGEPIRVRRVRHSECYQVVDGHHRAAVEILRGATEIRAGLDVGRVATPLQSLVTAMSWTEGRRELYQPIDAPELGADWPVVRRCTDRWEMMRTFLSGLDLRRGATSLDVGACYGWFVARMAEEGFDAHGVELDPRGAECAEKVFGVPRGRIEVGEASEFLRSAASYDVVSCFSVLHHFVLGRGPCTAEELAARLDRATKKVLFFDTGQGHEAWFADKLPEWDPDFIEKFLRTNTTFAHVIPLGIDADDRQPYAGNYGRTLFACVR